MSQKPSLVQSAQSVPGALTPDSLDRVKAPGEDGARRRISVLGAFKADRSQTSFAYRTVGQDFWLIVDGMAPVIVAREDSAKRALARLRSSQVSSGAAARALQTFIVMVPPRARDLLVARGHVRLVEEERFGDQFAELSAMELYGDETGLLWEDTDYLNLENAII